MAPVHLDFEVLDKGGYKLLTAIHYDSIRYGRSVTVPVGYISDGASGPAEDIVSEAWWVHDILCDTLKFRDGAPCSNWQASMVLHDILKAEGRWFRAKSWFLATLIGANFWQRLKGIFEIAVIVMGGGALFAVGLSWAIMEPIIK